MKNKPLTFQIWIVFASGVIVILLLLILFFSLTLRSFFTEETYKTIAEAQEDFDYRRIAEYIKNASSVEEAKELQEMRLVQHAIFIDRKLTKDIANSVKLKKVSPEIIKEIKDEALNQQEERKRYVKSIEGVQLFYIIQKRINPKREVYLVSYMWDTYKNTLVKNLLIQLAIGMGIAVTIFLIVARIFSNYLTTPLVTLEKSLQCIAKKDWNSPISIERGDEIGKLAACIENMRKELAANDRAQQSFLQHVSHALKTPVMVIRSYAQSIIDGVYPQGNLQDAAKVIENEAERLQKHISDLLYISRLDYLSDHQQVRQNINLPTLISTAAERLRFQRPKLHWDLQLQQATITGDEEQWKVLVENLLDNGIRYALSKISICLEKRDGKVYVEIFNDGDPIPENDIGNIFSIFWKGKKGKSGLGLAIAKRIVELHGGHISVKNKENGVSFLISVCMNEQQTF